MRSNLAALGSIFIVSFFAFGCAETVSPDTQRSTDSTSASASETEAAAAPTTEAEILETKSSASEFSEGNVPEEASDILLMSSTVWAGAQREDCSLLTEVTYDQLSLDETDYAGILFGESRSSETPSGLQTALSACNSSVKETTEAAASQLKEAALQDPSLSAGDSTVYYTLHNRLYVQRADDAVLSVLLCTDAYSHGAHGSRAFAGYRYDLRTGKALTLRGCFSDPKELVSRIQDRLLSLYPDAMLEETALSSKLTSMITSPETYGDLPFTLGPSDVTFWFAPGDLAAYAAGAMSVSFSYEELSGLLAEGLAPDDGEDAIVSLPESVPYDTGTKDSPLLFYAIPEQENGADTGKLTVLVTAGSGTSSLSLAGYETEYFLADAGDQRTLLLNTRQEDDWEELSCFDLSSMSLSDDGSALSMGLYGHIPTDPDCFVMEKRIQTLGTSLVSTLCGLGGNACPGALSSWFVEDQRVGDGLTAKAEVPAALGSAGTDPDKARLSEGTIPAGTVLTPLRTNGNDTVDCLTKDGALVRLVVDDPGAYPQTIGGTDVETLFDGIGFAG